MEGFGIALQSERVKGTTAELVRGNDGAMFI
jgi:hypothetical protein